MGYWPQNELRDSLGKDAYEREALKRLNPYDPGRAETAAPGQLTTGQRLRLMWARLRALFGRKQDDSAQEN